MWLQTSGESPETLTAVEALLPITRLRVRPLFPESSSSCSTASAPAPSRMPLRTATRAATRSATSRGRSGFACRRSARLGLDRIVDIGGSVSADAPRAAIGRMAEASAGKDSVTGHWEMMGIVLDRPFPVFPERIPEGAHRCVRAAHRPRHAWQLRRVGHEDHRRSRRRAHAHRQADRLHIGRQRVSDRRARGRHSHRRAVPHQRHRVRSGGWRVRPRARHRAPVRRAAGTLHANGQSQGLRDAADVGNRARSSDGGARSGRLPSARSRICLPDAASRAPFTPKSDDEGVDAVSSEMASTPRGLIFANLVDFDTLYGHRNDVAGLRRESRAVRRAAEGSAAAAASTTICW